MGGRRSLRRLYHPEPRFRSHLTGDPTDRPGVVAIRMRWNWSSTSGVAALGLGLALGCRAPNPPADEREPETAQTSTTAAPRLAPDGVQAFPGWPQPLVPRLQPVDGVDVTLRARPEPGAAVTGTCTLPPDAKVPWTRGAVRPARLGRLAALETRQLERVKKLPSSPEQMTAEFYREEPFIALELREGQSLEVWARVRGRCLVGVRGAARPALAVPCPHAGLDLNPPPDQSWWLEIGCTGGEGWFEVDPQLFEIEQFETRAPRDVR